MGGTDTYQGVKAEACEHGPQPSSPQ
jgi:hypothetical protein